MYKMLYNLIFLTVVLASQSACVCDQIRIEKNYYTATTQAVEALLPANIPVAISGYNDSMSSEANFLKQAVVYSDNLKDTDESKQKIKSTVSTINDQSLNLIKALNDCQSYVASKNTELMDNSIASAQKQLDQIRNSMNSLRSYLSTSSPVNSKEKQLRINIISLVDSFDSNINSQLVITLSKLNNYLLDLKLRQKYESEFVKNKCS